MKFYNHQIEKEVVYIAAKLIKKHHIDITIVDYLSLLIIGSELLYTDTRRKADQIVFQSQPPENLFLLSHIPITNRVNNLLFNMKFLSLILFKESI